MHTDKLSDDRVEIRGLDVPVLVGVLPHEQAEPRRLLIDLDLFIPGLQAAGASDRLEDTADYADLCRRVRAACAGRRYRLVEAVAESVAAVCLAEPLVARVRVRVAKPGAVADAAEVAVRITRSRAG